MRQRNLVNPTRNMETIFYPMHKTALGVAKPLAAPRQIASLIS